MTRLAELETKRSGQRNAIVALQRTLNEQKGVWNDGQEANWTQANNDYNDTIEEIRKEKIVSDVNARVKEINDYESQADNPDGIGRSDAGGKKSGSKGPSEEVRLEAMAGYIRRSADMPISKRQREAMKTCRVSARSINLCLPSNGQYQDLQTRYRDGHPTTFRNRLKDLRGLSAITPAAGGMLVPETFLRELLVNMLFYSSMDQVATMLITNDGGNVTMPTADDTSNEGELVSENSTQNDADPTFGGLILGAHKYSSKFIKFPTELVEDSAFDVVAMAGRMTGERLGRITNRHHTTGDGANKAKGIVTSASLGQTTASATAFTWEEIIDLETSLDQSYSDAPGVGYMMHKNITGALRKLKDGDGKYIWVPGKDKNDVDRLNGYPITLNSVMDSATTSLKKIMLFGDLSRYHIRRVRGIRFRMLMERFADTDQQGAIAFVREDGGLWDAGVSPVKYLQMHS